MTIKIDIDKDGKPDVIRVYERRHQKGNTYVANVKLGSTKMDRKKKKKKK